MVYCVRAQLAFSTANRRNNVQSAIETRIAGRARWSADRIERAVLRAGQHGLIVEFRFVSRADEEDLLARLDALFPQNPPLPGSTVTLHDCTHDEGSNSCAVTTERAW